MANKQVINHTDIAEKGATKPLIEEMIALLNVIKDVDGSIVKLAKDLKIMLSSAKPDSLQGINKLTENSEAANRVYDARIKLMKEEKRLTGDLVEGMNQQAQYNAKLKVELEGVNRANKENAKLNSSTVSSYEKATIQLNRMAKVLKDLVYLGKSNTTEFKNLKKTYDDLFTSISNAEQTVGQFQRNVGNYASGFSPLRNSITQLTRELPAFANSFQTGFMAISNNVGALKDAISQINAQNAILKANGEKTIPVWRQLTSAFLSWNTVISVGVTLLTVYGSKIGEWVKSLFSAETAINLTEKAAKRLAKVQEDAARNAVEENTKLTILLKTAQNVTISYDERKRAVDELQKTYPNYFKNLREEDILAGNTADAELRLRDAILSKARAQAASAAIVENETRRLEILKEIRETEKQLAGARNLYAQAEKKLAESTSGNVRSIDLYASRAQAAEVLVESKINAIKDLNNELKVIESENKTLIDEIVKVQGQILTLEDKTKDKSDEKAKRDAEKRMREAERLRKQNEKEFDELFSLLEKQRDREVEIEEERKKRNQKEFDDLFAQLERERDMEARIDEERAENAKRAREKEAQERSRFLQQQVDNLQRFAQRETDINNQKISDELGANQRRQDQLRELAAKGSLDAQNSLALEERKRAELEAQRIKNLKNQKRQELIFAGIKAYAANVEKNPDGAFAKTSKDLIKLTSLLTNLPSFKKGTENTGNVGHGVDGEGGFHAILHPNERVLTKEQNMKIGDFTNEELANLAYMANSGMLGNNLGSVFIEGNKNVVDSIKDLKETIERKPTQTFEVDEVKKLIHITTETMHSRKTNTRRIGRYGF